jgi:hypothetical protein
MAAIEPDLPPATAVTDVNISAKDTTKYGPWQKFVSFIWDRYA